MPRAILLIDHGSRRAEANAMLARMAELVQARAGASVTVELAHMELAEPTIDQALTACVRAGATEIVVQPFMLAPGRHATEDIPRLVREAADAHTGVQLRFADPLGVHPALAEVVIDRVASACAERRSGDE